MSASSSLRTSTIAAKLGAMKHLHWLLIIPAPLFVAASYWLLVDPRSGPLDWIVIAVGVGVGFVGIWLAPWSRGAQAAAAFAYLPVMGFLLAASILLFECSTGNCL